MTATLQPDRMPGYVLPKYEFRKPPELAGGASPLYPVAIVGAGLAGLVTALELSSRGVNCVLLDDDDTVGAQGLSSRGICHAKRSLEIYDRFGVAERIRAKGVTWNEGDVYVRDERIYTFNLQPEQDQKFPAFVNLQQFYVEQYLVEALVRAAPDTLRWKNRVVDVQPHADHVALSVETPAGRYSLRAQYVVAADGAHSVLRDRLGAKDEESALFEHIWCIADVKLAGTPGAVRRSYLDAPQNEGGAIWYHQMADGVWRTDWLITHYDDPEGEAKPERARKRLEKLLGPGASFELVWVGPWRFRRRVLEKMRHGRVFFMGDASAQHSPFGARGGNRAVQDANNLAWKLALVVQGKADAALLDTYETERHFAARENVEVASRSALFIAPETAGQRLVRDAFLALARRHAWARALVNVGRLSVASVYAHSPLNAERGSFASALAQPGAAAPDGRYGDGFFAERLQGGFTVAYFGAEGPAIAGAQTLQVARKSHEALFARYGVAGQATYVFRPDGHVLARCTGIDAAFAASVIERVLVLRAAEPARAAVSVQPEADRLFDALSRQIDAMPAAARAVTLAMAVERIERARGNLAGIAGA
ncbi:MAG TPA: FAD-dependent oxidoreductase [Burkholderiales bacterium]